jgi:solute carrier family 19 (thiamine transporter), member 2/3
MQVMQVTFGLSTAASVGFFASVTALFPTQMTAKWNGLLRASILIGHVVGSLASHLFLSLGLHMSHLYLFSFVSLLVGLAVSFLFPRHSTATQTILQRSALEIPGPRDDVRAAQHVPAVGPKVASGPLSGSLRDVLERTKRTFGDSEVIVWSVCWCFLFASLCLAEGYIAAIWLECYLVNRNADPDGASTYMNGLMDALGRTMGASGSIVGGCIPLSRHRPRMLILTQMFCFSLFALSIILIAYSYEEQLWLSAVSYCFMMGLGYALVSYLTGMMALMVERAEDHPFMLGTQTIASMIVQTIVQVGTNGLTLAARFLIFGSITVFPLASMLLYLGYRSLRSQSDSGS